MEGLFGGEAVAGVGTSQKVLNRVLSSTADDHNVFSLRSVRELNDDDEEALRWAALEKLPTYDRVRRGILENIEGETGHVTHKVVDVANLNFAQRQRLLEKILQDTEDDNEKFLLRLRERMDKVGIELPTIEVRYQDLTVETEVHVGSKALPTLFNFTVNLFEGLLDNCLQHSWKRKQQLTILKGINGIIKPSRMTLLLGPPNSGKTTFLLALAGKLSSDLKVSGDITYNGHALTEFIPQRTSAYISQQDLQLGEMTVREALDFSTRCQGVGNRNDVLTELLRREKEHGILPDTDLDVFMKAISLEGQETNLVTDYVIKILGLDICADTLVGDQMRRGISGGQKKRVTTGEMLVGPAKVFFMDEISTGLDSSTTFQIVNCLHHIVHIMDETMVVSLLQPAPETFELFDDIILLSEGIIIYHGPRDFVLDFFEDIGFKCPERKSVADFLQEVTSIKDQAQYWADKSVPYRYIPAKEFSDRFASFHVGRSMQEELSIPFDKSKSHPEALSTKMYGLKKWELFKACFWREWLLMRRNSFVYIFKTCQISVVSIIGMTVFFRTTLHSDTIMDGNLYLGALFFGLTNVMFNGFADLGMVISRLPVFYKQRDQLFYPAWAYAIPAIIMRIPVSILESTIWVCLTYYVIGFSPEPVRFFLQLLLLFSVSIMALGLFRCLGAIGRSPIMATTFGSFSLMLVFVLGGFVISKEMKFPENVPKWWIWANWSSPMMYGQNAIAINEFLGNRWQKPNNDTSINAETIGEAVLKSRGMFTEGYWYWISLGALIAFAVLFNCIFTFALAYLNPLGKPQAVVNDKDPNEQSSGARQDVSSNETKKVQVFSGPSRKSSNDEGFDERLDSLDTEVVTVNGGMILPFQPLSITFNNINYYVDMPNEMKQQGVSDDKLQLLRNVSGAFRPGVLTALMGVSGAGKTTLMDVLAGRKTGGYIKGDITISGFPKKQETFARISGYCEQNDIHSPNVTVHESLIFSAWLRLSNDVKKETRMMFVKEVMELVELDPLKEALVGLPGIYGLSTEQRKRLTIAVELVANPSIIFMDEPTSGLDARAAAIVMRTVRNTVNTGRTVVCTIHQPSIDIFESFDELLLLKRGGEVIYSGSLGYHSQALIQYFQAIPGIPKIKDGYNPATWMLEITSPARESRLGVDFAHIYRESPLYQNCQDLIKEISVPEIGSKELYFSTKYAQGFLVQCQACLWKRHWSYWRNPNYNVVRLLFTTAVAVIFGTVFWKMGSKKGTVQDVNNLMGALYAMIFFLGVSNSNTVGPVVAIERTVYYREKAAGMYSCLAYAFAQVAIEIPYVMVQTIIYALIIFSTLGLPWQAGKFFYFAYFMFFTFLYFTCYGMMAVALTPSLHFATIISSSVNSLWNLFSGFMIPRTRIPVWWRWYYWVDPISWTLYGLIESQLGDLDNEQLDVPGRGKEAVSLYLEQYFGYHQSFLGVVVAMHVVFTLLFVCVYGFCIRNFNFQRR